MKWGLLLLSLFLVGAKPTTSHVLAWETTVSVIDAWELEQCQNTRNGCIMQPIAALSPDTRAFTVAGLSHNRSYCWRVKPVAVGEQYDYSNMVCN